jgi:tripartite ATP-independent transporter DctM subunit
MYHDIATTGANGHPHFTGVRRMMPSRLDEPLRARKGRKIFVNDMGDLFFEGHPFEDIARVFAVMALALVYRGVTSVLALFVLMMGGIYVGVFTATEAAGIGTFVALIIAVARRSLSWRDLYESLVESARTTSMLFIILIGALMFAEFVNLTSMPTDLQEIVTRFAPHPIMVVVAMMVIYVILGTAMEELSMVLLTLPIFFPIVVHLGFDPVWFGIVMVVWLEIGFITPPVGLNLFVIQGMLPGSSATDVIRGTTPFVILMILLVALLFLFPELALWLPKQIVAK